MAKMPAKQQQQQMQRGGHLELLEELGIPPRSDGCDLRVERLRAHLEANLKDPHHDRGLRDTR